MNIDAGYYNETNELQMELLKTIEHEVERLVTSIDEANYKELSIYPNPSANEMHIEFPTTTENQKFNLQIYTVKGQLVLQKNNLENRTSIHKDLLSPRPLLSSNLFWIKAYLKRKNYIRIIQWSIQQLQKRNLERHPTYGKKTNHIFLGLPPFWYSFFLLT